MVNNHFAPPFGEIFLGHFFQAFSGRKSTIGFLRGVVIPLIFPNVP